MKINRYTAFTWRRFLISIFIIAAASGLRHFFFAGLGRGIPYLTFYPAIMVAAIYGGIYSGLLSTIVSAFLIYYWIQKGYMSNLEWLAMFVFIFSSVFISAIAEAMRLANRKAMEAKTQAQIANQAKSAFLANMSHELRTPLNAILGYSQLMQRDNFLTLKHRDYLNTINRSGEHLLALINDILEISKIEANRVTLESIDFNLPQLIEDIKKMFEIKTKAKGLIFEISGISELPLFINTDETKLRIILINLIGNAVKFTEKGSVRVRFSIKKDLTGEKFLIVEIEDTGPGIAENEKNKLFKYFIQTESGKKSKSGTGLGLAISLDYAKTMQGEITVTSVLGVGSTFTLKVNIKECLIDRVNLDIMQKRVIGLVADQQIIRVLIAEDHIENRKLLVELFSSIGLEIKEAVNGKEAFEIFKQWQPHFIWMDIRMPVMDGLEATRLIKATEFGKKTIIVALSAHVLGEEKNEIYAAGIDNFVGKPFKEAELFGMMEKYLGLKYIYETVKSVNNITPFDIDLVLHLKTLDEKLLKELNSAVISTNAMNLMHVAIKISQQKPVLSEALKYYASNFDYEPIRAALQDNLNTK